MINDIKNYKLLIIDDDLDGRYNRRRCYSKFFGEKFEVNFVEKYEDLHNIKIYKYDLVVIDYYLGKWESNLECKDILSDFIPPAIPCLIVSSKWNERDREALHNIAKYSKTQNILQLIDFQVIIDYIDDEKSIILKDMITNIIYLLQVYNRQSVTNIEQDKSIIITHFSDFQFGTEHTKYNTFMWDAVPSYYRDQGLTTNFTIISGDIAQQGLPSEYVDAKTWFDEYLEQTYREYNERKRFRLFFCNGNHDCDFNIMAKNKYRYDLKQKNFIVNPVKSVKYDNTASFEEYRKFVKLLCPETASSDFENNSMCNVDDSYIKWGIRLIILNVMNNISPGKHYGAAVDLDRLTELKKYISNNSNDNIFTIMITHYGPSMLKHDDIDSFRTVHAFLTAAKVNMWVYGHYHKAESITYQEDEHTRDKILCCCSGSITLSKKDIDEGAEKAFLSYELKREYGKVREVIVKKISCEKSQVREYSSTPYKLNKEGKFVNMDNVRNLT